MLSHQHRDVRVAALQLLGTLPATVVAEHASTIARLANMDPDSLVRFQAKARQQTPCARTPLAFAALLRHFVSRHAFVSRTTSALHLPQDAHRVDCVLWRVQSTLSKPQVEEAVTDRFNLASSSSRARPMAGSRAMQMHAPRILSFSTSPAQPDGGQDAAAASFTAGASASSRGAPPGGSPPACGRAMSTFSFRGPASSRVS